MAGKDLASDISTAVGELIKGSSGSLVSPLPPDTKIRQVFVTKDGTAYVDFGKGLGEGTSYGASSEMATVYSIVNTVAFNFKTVRKVSILVEGSRTGNPGRAYRPQPAVRSPILARREIADHSP